MSAAIGITVGGGFYRLAAAATLLTIATNLGLGLVERRLGKPPGPASGEPRPRAMNRPGATRPDP
jgi:uncharacterized membrane protein YhiD involved in acid resistance